VTDTFIIVSVIGSTVVVPEDHHILTSGPPATIHDLLDHRFDVARSILCIYIPGIRKVPRHVGGRMRTAHKIGIGRKRRRVVCVLAVNLVIDLPGSFLKTRRQRQRCTTDRRRVRHGDGLEPKAAVHVGEMRGLIPRIDATPIQLYARATVYPGVVGARTHLLVHRRVKHQPALRHPDQRITAHANQQVIGAPLFPEPLTQRGTLAFVLLDIYIADRQKRKQPVQCIA